MMDERNLYKKARVSAAISMPVYLALVKFSENNSMTISETIDYFISFGLWQKGVVVHD